MKRLKTEPEKELTKAELEVMQILWKLKKAFVGDILDRMVEPKPAYNTVSTVVRLLEKKGVVGHESFGKSHRYYPLVDKETYEAEYFSCHPCLCTSTIKLKTSDVKNVLLPKVHHEPIVVEL